MNEELESRWSGHESRRARSLPGATVRMASGFSRMSARLILAFVGILCLFALALIANQIALNRLGKAIDRVALLDHAKHTGHRAAALIREQYIHQAHTIIERDLSHLQHYREAVGRARAAAEELERALPDEKERSSAREIAMLARENDRVFERRVVPAVASEEFERAYALHPKLDSLVSRVVALNDEVNAALERQSGEARIHARELQAWAETIMLVCCALAILIAAVVSVLLMRSILLPIATLRDGALRVAAGDLTTRIRVRGRDELAELAEVFNRMTAEVARHQAELVRSQRLAAVGEVAAGVAHEINNPLSVILGYLKMLRREAEGRDRRLQDELRIIEDEALQCRRIVQGLLDLARPSALAITDVDLVELARDCVHRLQESGRVEGRVIDGPPEGLSVITSADQAKIRQVIANLLLNAIEASSAGGRVFVRAEARAGEAIVTVADEGQGIDPAVLPHVFDPFYSRKADGAGLGLAVSQAIANAHGGRIDLTSVQGRGTRAELRLPLLTERRSEPT
ncbi:MAG: HAMP domain-containing protein [Candidatus Methylomirabilis sp.]|nr:HAMP domain-containing protein [Deltaproteobacteria bacterium]